MKRYEVTRLTEASYAEFRAELDRIIAHPGRRFALVENAEEAVIRAVLGAMSHGGDTFGEPIEGAVRVRAARPVPRRARRLGQPADTGGRNRGQARGRAL